MGRVDVGDRLQDHELTVVYPDGPSESTTLSNLAAERPVLLSFWLDELDPESQDAWSPFLEFAWFDSHPHVRVVGVSQSAAPPTDGTDGAPAGMGFPLAADTEGALAAAFGLDDQSTPGDHPVRWACFLLDDELTVCDRWPADREVSSERSSPPVGRIHDDVNRLIGPPSDELIYDAPSRA